MKGSIWINFLVGVWLIISSFALHATGAAHAWVANDIVFGILLIAFSWWIAVAIAPPLGASWFEILCGIWLIVAPFVLGYSRIMTAVWNDVICGIIAIIVAAIASQAITRPSRVPVK